MALKTKTELQWRMVKISFFGNFLFAGTMFYLMNAFMDPLTEAYGWSRSDINYAMTAAAFMSPLGAFLWGTLVMRYGPRKLMSLGAVLGGGVTILMGNTDSIIFFGIYLGLLWCFSQACGGIVASTLVNDWFLAKRGIALGLANAGLSVSGAIMPLLALFALNHIGVAASYTILGIIMIALGPVCWLLIQDRPAEYELHPKDGSDTGPKTSETKSPARGINLMEMLRIPQIYLIGVAFGLAFMATIGIMSQLKPRLTDLGFSDLNAMLLMCMAAACGAFGKYFWGMVCDWTNPRRAAVMLMICNTVSVPLALIPNSTLAVVTFVVVYGTSMGGIWAVVTTITADVFGQKNFASAFRVISIFYMIKIAGYTIAGLSLDFTGGYGAAYVTYTVSLLIATVLLLFVKVYAPPEGTQSLTL